MRLLKEIIEELSSSAPSLENALFKAQVLAHQLGEQELKQWVASELKGYPNRASLPPYRIIPVTVMASINNGVKRYPEQPLPLMRIDKRLREKLEHTHLIQSIAVIEEWSKNDSDLSVVIAPEYYPHISGGIDPSFEIERAWGKHSVGAMLQVVVEVRSRLLELALEVSDRIPLEPEPERIKQVSQEVAVSEVFRNAVFGSNTTIVVGSGTIHSVTNSIAANDLESLARALRTHHVRDEDIDDLHQAIAADANTDDVRSRKLGPAVKGWIAAMVKKSAEGVWDVGVTAAGGLLGSAISAYYGFGAM